MKKEFKDMSQSEIDVMSKEEFNAVDPFEKQGCFDCASLKVAINLWCVNKEAISARGTSIPGCIKCKFWTPNWTYIDSKYHYRRKDLVVVNDTTIPTKKVPNLFRRFIVWLKNTL